MRRSTCGGTGAPADNTAAGVDAGSAYVFDPTTGEQWLKLTASDASAGAAFGASVAIDNNTALIGAYRDSGSADGAGARGLVAAWGLLEWGQVGLGLVASAIFVAALS